MSNEHGWIHGGELRLVYPLRERPTATRLHDRLPRQPLSGTFWCLFDLGWYNLEGGNRVIDTTSEWWYIDHVSHAIPKVSIKIAYFLCTTAHP